MEEKFYRTVEVKVVEVNCSECGNELLAAIEDEENIIPVVYCDECYERMKEAKEDCEHKIEEIRELAVVE